MKLNLSDSVKAIFMSVDRLNIGSRITTTSYTDAKQLLITLNESGYTDLAELFKYLVKVMTDYHFDNGRVMSNKGYIHREIWNHIYGLKLWEKLNGDAQDYENINMVTYRVHHAISNKNQILRQSKADPTPPVFSLSEYRNRKPRQEAVYEHKPVLASDIRYCNRSRWA